MERNLELGGGVFTSTGYHARRELNYQNFAKWVTGVKYPYVTIDADTMVVGAYILALTPIDASVTINMGFKVVGTDGAITYGTEISGANLAIPALDTFTYKPLTIYCKTPKEVFFDVNKALTKGSFTVVLDLIRLDTQVHYKMNIPRVQN